MKSRGLGSGGEPGVGNDEVAAVCPLGLEVLHYRRHGNRRVAAHQQNGFSVGDVLQGEGKPPVHAQCPGSRRRRGGHAEAAVVINVGRAQRHPREFAQQIGLFIGQGAAAEDAHGVPAILGLSGLNRPGYGGNRLVPGGGRQFPGGIADKGGEQPVRVAERVCRGPSLDAERALVDGKIGIGGNRRPAPIIVELHSALERAVGAVSWGSHQT